MRFDAAGFRIGTGAGSRLVLVMYYTYRFRASTIYSDGRFLFFFHYLLYFCCLAYCLCYCSFGFKWLYSDLNLLRSFYFVLVPCFVFFLVPCECE